MRRLPMTLSFLWAACASSAPQNATPADFSAVAQAERELDVAQARAGDEDLPCVERGNAGARASAAAERICTLAAERPDADLTRRCEAARLLSTQAVALAERGCAEPSEASP